MDRGERADLEAERGLNHAPGVSAPPLHLRFGHEMEGKLRDDREGFDGCGIGKGFLKETGRLRGCIGEGAAQCGPFHDPGKLEA